MSLSPRSSDAADAAIDFAIDRRREREQEFPVTSAQLIKDIKSELAHLEWLHSQMRQHPYPRVWLELIAAAELNIAEMDERLMAMTCETTLDASGQNKQAGE